MPGFDTVGALPVGAIPADILYASAFRFEEEIEGHPSAAMRFLVETYPLQLGAGSADTFEFPAVGEAPVGALADVGDEAASAIVPRYFADGPFTTVNDELPANRVYLARAEQPLFLRRTIAVSDSGFSGVTPIGGGEVRLTNLDGGLDGMLNSSRFHGRMVRVLAGGIADRAKGEARWRKAQFKEVFRGTTTEPRQAGKSIILPLRDVLLLLDVPFVSNRYTGDGGLEGGTDLAGKAKPNAIGQFWQVNPPLVDAANLVYQVHDGRMQSIDRVSDRGVDLLFDANYASYAALTASGSIGGGEYGTCLAEGLIRLGGNPDGVVTVDGKGGVFGGTYYDTTAGCIYAMTHHVLGIADQYHDDSSFDALDALQPADVGHWFGPDGEMSGRQAVGILLRGAGAYMIGSRQGRIALGRIDAPSGLPEFEYTQAQIRNIERLELPAALSPAVWEVRVGFQHYQFPQRFDIDTAVTMARRQQLAQEWRFPAPAQDATVQSENEGARSLRVPGCFAAQADAEAEQERLAELLGDAKAYRIPLAGRPFTREIGEVHRFTYPAPGFEHGPLATVYGVADDGKGKTVELEVLVT